ncbi:MAG TPA: sugar ABC transporter permease, partial [Candidatus Eisenbacteria bacterium]
MTVQTARPISHRRRFLAGLALATLAGVALLTLGIVASRSAERGEAARRLGIVRVQALAQSLERAGIEGDAARDLVRRWAASDSSLQSIRVIAFSGITLEASTAPEDVGDLAAPRRLGREEKALYDQGQRLRASAETNRQEGAARKAEIEIVAG